MDIKTHKIELNKIMDSLTITNVGKAIGDDELSCYLSNFTHRLRNHIMMLYDELDELNGNNVKLNSHGVNSNIKCRILPDDKMEVIGFRNTYYNSKEKAPYWYFSKWFDENIELTVHIPYDDENEIDICVLDDRFCQPYDYQRILYDRPDHDFASEVKKFVDETLLYLQEVGIISGFNPDAYV